MVDDENKFWLFISGLRHISVGALFFLFDGYVNRKSRKIPKTGKPCSVSRKGVELCVGYDVCSCFADSYDFPLFKRRRGVPQDNVYHYGQLCVRNRCGHCRFYDNKCFDKEKEGAFR